MPGPAPKEKAYRSMRNLFKHYVRSCRRKNIFWDLTVEQFHKLTSSPCHYCGKRPSRKIRNYLYNGIDRLNNNKGYLIGNVEAACTECNWIKGNRLTHDEMVVVGEALNRFRQRRI